MIEIKNLQKSFGDNHVLKDINITIEDGEIYGLVGVSGAGKSTILRCINGLEPYDSGSLKVDGVELSSLDGSQLRQFRSGIGMIFQQFNLMERMNVFDNIAFPMKCHGFSKQEIRDRVDELLEMVNLAEKRKARPRELSGGQKQRVAIARALTLRPKILLCDEATSSLDPNITRSILELLRQINRELGLTIIIVTHQMSVVKQTCSRMSVLSHGELTCTGKVEDIFMQQPQALEELINEDTGSILPETGVNLEIFHRNGQPSDLLSKMALETGVPFEIVWGKLDRYCSGIYGSFTVHMEKEDIDAVKGFLEKNNAEWRVL